MSVLLKYVTKKTLIFGLAGAIGAACGTLIFDFLIRWENHTTYVAVVSSVALWAGIISIGIVLALQAVQNNYQKKYLISKSMIKPSLYSFVIGGLAGAFAQIAFGLTYEISETAEIISRIFCWGFLGLGIGFSVTAFIPNFPKKRAVIAGLIGGTIGGTIFRFSFEVFSDEWGRILGVATLGFFIGLFISYVEEVLREAWLTIVWAKNEFTSVALGTREIILGSSPKADIYLPVEKGYPKITAVIELIGSSVFIENKIDGKKTELRNGSKIQMGEIEVIVNMKTSKS